MPPQPRLVDNLGNVYTLAGGAIYVNGVGDGNSANITEVVWDKTHIWQHSGKQWDYQSGPCPNCAPNQPGAWIPDTTGPSCAVTGPTSTATATTSPSITATATVTLTATATQTATPTATATRGPSATATATVTATARVTATQTATATAGGATATATPGAGSTAAVSLTPAVTGVNRFGLNTGNSDNFFGPNAITSNYFDNGGFEPPSVAHLIIVGKKATASSFSDISDGGTLGVDWIGAKASVRTGASAGDQFTVTSYTNGGFYTFGSCQDASGNSIGCPTLETGAAVAEVLTGTTVLGGMAGGDPGQVGGWQTSDPTHCGYSTAQAMDGVGSAACDVSDGGSHAIEHYYDFGGPSTGGVCSNDNVTPCTVANENVDCGSGSATCLAAPQAGPWHPVVGPFEIAFYAKAVNTSSGTPQVSISLVRNGGGTNVSHTFKLTNDGNWHQYVFPFTGTDTGWSGGQNQQEMIFSLTASNGSAESGASIYVDDAYLGKQAASATGFRSEFMSTIQALNPGSIRLMSGGTMSAPRAGLEGLSGCTPGQGAGPDAPGTCDFQHGAVNGTNIGGGQWIYSSADLYPLSNQLGAAPWFSISNMFNDADLKTFVDNACTALATNTNIPAIYIEQSNEEWNSPSPSQSVRFGSSNLGTGPLGYGAETGRNFSIMSAEVTAHCPSLAGKFYYVIGNQTCNNGVVGAALQGATNAGYPIPNTDHYGIADAPYYGASVSESGSMEAQAQAYATDFTSQIPIILGPQGTGCMNSGGGAEWAFIGSNNFVGFYETGPNASGGPASTEQLYLSEAGYPSAEWMAYSWLLGQKGRNETGVPFPGGRIPVQNEFTLVQTEYGGAPIWGFVHDFDADFGPTFPHLRPIGIGMEVINSAVQQGGALFAVNGGPSGVVVNPYNANSSGTGQWTAALVNTTAAPVTLTVAFPASGTMPETAEAVLNTHGITDNAENSNDVYLGSLPGGLSTSGQNLTLTLPPFSVVAIH